MMREDWVECSLIEGCDIYDNLRKPINSKERNDRINGKAEDELFPYYGATGQVGFIDDYLTDGDYVLIGEDAAPFLDYTKDVAYQITGKTWVNNHAHILKSKFNDMFLLHFLNNFNYKNYVSGTTRLKLTQGRLKQIPVKIAPLPEQRAIVAKIEELFSDLDKGIADLKTAQAQLKVYRQAVLKKAFEGELTKQWRASQTNLPTADELLEQIKQERQKHYDQQLADWEKAVKDWEANGKEGKKIVKPKKISKFHIPTNSIKHLPVNWTTTNLELIGTWSGGGTPSKSNKSYWKDGTVLWVTSKDMKVKDIFDSQNKITKESVDQSSAKYIKENSILVVLRSGILRRILPVAINRKICTVNQDLQALTPYYVDSEYIYWYMVSNDFDIRHKCAKDGTTVESVEANALKKYLFPYCSQKEQHQIIKEIESRLSVCDKVDQTITESLEKAKALRQSILKKAFEGTLLSTAEIEKCKQQPDYEPASVLLEKIKAESAEKQAALKKSQLKKPVNKRKGHGKK